MPRPARIPRSVPVSKRMPDPRRNVAHLAYVRKLSCAACFRQGQSQAHHESFDAEAPGLTLKDDKTAVPLCAECHTRRHAKGPITFWKDTDIAVGLARALWRLSGDEEAGQRVVFRAWQAMQSKESERV